MSEGNALTYKQNLPIAARRHLRAAEELHGLTQSGSQPGCKAVAGYLFGLAGELAVKCMMLDSGMLPASKEQRSDDPFYKHFPVLKTLLRDQIRGRRAGELRAIAESDTLFQFWDTTMRYAATSEIPEARVAAWRRSANELILRMDSV